MVNIGRKILKSLLVKRIIFRDADNRIKSFILLGDDITKLMRENIAYKKVGKLAEAVMDNIPGLIAILREKGDRIVLGDANANFIKAFGLQKRNGIKPGYQWYF